MMPLDFPLHLTFLAALLTLAVVRVWYWRRQRELLGMAFSEQQRVYADTRQIGAMLGFLLVLVHLANPRILGWTEFPLPGTVRWAGAILTIVAIAICARAAHDEIDALRNARRQAFVPGGLFRYVRHPIEGGLVVLAVALTLLTADWVVALLTGGLALHGLWVRAPRVERQRLASAGAVYEAYAMTTPALVPRRHAKS